MDVYKILFLIPQYFTRHANAFISFYFFIHLKQLQSLNSLPASVKPIQVSMDKTLKRNLKIVVVGDGACGKTSLIVAHAGGGFTEQYTPTAFDDYPIEALVNGKTVSFCYKF